MHAEFATASDGLQLAIRPAQVADFWALAEVHCTSFYPRAQWPFAPFLRLDRIVALKVLGRLLDARARRADALRRCQQPRRTVRLSWCDTACSASGRCRACARTIYLARPVWTHDA